MVNDVIKDSVESAKYDVKNVKMFLDFFHGSGSRLRKKVKSGQKDLDPKH